MNWRAMADKANQVFQQRGGATAAKEDTEELRNIAQGQGSVADKVKQAAEALREPAPTTPTRPTRHRGKRAMCDPRPDRRGYRSASTLGKRAGQVPSDGPRCASRLPRSCAVRQPFTG